MSILYLCIVNLNNKSIIGSYNPVEMNNSSLKLLIENKTNELINKLKVENGPEKNVINFQSLSDKKIDVYYSLINKGILYIVFVEVLSIYLELFKEDSIFELIEHIDSQGIKLNTDNTGKLSNVGKQNLKFAVEKYQNTFFSRNDVRASPSLIEEAPHDNKIAVINEQIKGISNDMKNNVKNMIEIEGKSVSIKDASFQFRRNSLALERKMKCNVFKNRIILILVVVFLLVIIIYFIAK